MLRVQVTVKPELGPVNFGEQFSTKGERDEKPYLARGSLELIGDFQRSCIVFRPALGEHSVGCWCPMAVQWWRRRICLLKHI